MKMQRGECILVSCGGEDTYHYRKFGTVVKSFDPDVVFNAYVNEDHKGKLLHVLEEEFADYLIKKGFIRQVQLYEFNVSHSFAYGKPEDKYYLTMETIVRMGKPKPSSSFTK